MMFAVQNYEEWRERASASLRAGVEPAEIRWVDGGDTQESLFERPGSAVPASGSAVMIPRAFLVLAETVARHSDRTRWATLYRVAWRLAHGERQLLENSIDSDVAALDGMRRAVDKDIYEMRQFVRFRRVETEEGERYVAWYDPAHHTLDANGAFFSDRFASMRWAILTPDATMTWDREKLEHGPGVPRSHAPKEDELEDLWRTYYKTIFNPARLKITAMRAQLPVGRWGNLPEARAIPELVRDAQMRVEGMAAAQPVSAAQFIPPHATLDELRVAVRGCRACELCSRASGPVFGEGNPHARWVLIGEQPGDEEDRAGRPFVGPAGQVLDRALGDAGIARGDLYIANAVKAFKFEERGKRRIHHNPRASEIATCKPWMEAEIDLVQPQLLVCLGGSAAQAVLGRKVSIAAERGKLLAIGPRRAMVTYHPSAILRTPDPAMQRDTYSALVADLRAAKVAGS